MDSRSIAQAIAFVGALALNTEAHAQNPQDRDRDGVPDATDLCPADTETPNRVADEDGCPDRDSDGDLVADEYDGCPSQGETVNRFQDDDGCPDEAGAQLRALAQRILFATGRADLNAAGRSTVGEVQRTLAAHPEVTVVRIEGHADARGSTEANHVLSSRRATTVRDTLVAAGIPVTRLQSVGRGSLPGDSSSIQAENRRVDFVVAETRGHGGFPVVELTPVSGTWNGAGAVDVHVGSGPDDVSLTVRPGAPSWLGTVGARLGCYGVGRVGDRLVLHCRGVDVEVTLVARRSGSGGQGWITSGRGASARRIVWTSSRVDPLPTNIGVTILAYGRDESDGSDVGWNAGYPNPSFDDDPDRTGLPNARWQGAHVWESGRLCLFVRNLEAPYPPAHTLAIGYTVTLDGATFPNGSARQNVVMHRFSGTPTGQEIRQCLEVAQDPSHSHGPAAGSTCSALTDPEVTRRSWQFGRADGSVIASNMALEAGGHVSGYNHPNESRWSLEGGALVFFNMDGRATTRFSAARSESGSCILEGRFLLDPAANVTHVLRETGIVALPTRAPAAPSISTEGEVGLQSATVTIGSFSVRCEVNQSNGILAKCTLDGSADPPAVVSPVWGASPEIMCSRTPPEFSFAHGGVWASEREENVRLPAAGGRAILAPGVEVWFDSDLRTLEVSSTGGAARIDMDGMNGTVMATALASRSAARQLDTPVIVDLGSPPRYQRRGRRRFAPCVSR